MYNTVTLIRFIFTRVGVEIIQADGPAYVEWQYWKVDTPHIPFFDCLTSTSKDLPAIRPKNVVTCETSEIEFSDLFPGKSKDSSQILSGLSFYSRCFAENDYEHIILSNSPQRNQFVSGIVPCSSDRLLTTLGQPSTYRPPEGTHLIS
jgi:hypothetical protein